MSSSPRGLDHSHAARLSRYATVSTSLSLLSDARLGELLDDTPVVEAGIGGTSTSLEIAGVPVFVKRLPLTEIERQEGNVMSTRNLFELPSFCQYGVGSPGFGAWREVAATTMATNWVLTGRSENFPLMYHWRVLEGPIHRSWLNDQREERARSVAFWHGSSAVGSRLEALAAAPASVILFLEHIPQNLQDWMNEQLAPGGGAVAAACAMVEQNLRAVVVFMRAGELLHFDVHFRNVLTDGQRLYLGDFGLATSPRFELSEVEKAFVDDNLSHDACQAWQQLVNALVTGLAGLNDAAERNDFIRRCAGGEVPTGIPAPAAAMIQHYAPVATVMNDFYWKLHRESRMTPYPVQALRQACSSERIFER